MIKSNFLFLSFLGAVTLCGGLPAAPANSTTVTLTNVGTVTDTTTNLGAGLPGLRTSSRTNNKPIDSLQTEDLIIQTMVNLMLMDPNTRLTRQVGGLPRIPNVAISWLPQDNAVLTPVQVAQALYETLNWLAQRFQDVFMQAFTKIELNGRVIGFVEVLYSTGPLAEVELISSNATSTIADAAEPPEEGSLSVFAKRENPSDDQDISMPVNTTLFEHTQASLLTGVLSHVSFVGNTNHGQHQIFLALANAIFGFRTVAESLEADTIRYRTPWLGLQIAIFSEKRTAPPRNTRTYTLQLLSAIGNTVANERNFSSVVASGMVGDTQIVKILIVPTPR